MEVAETATSFLAFQNTCLCSDFFQFVGITFNVAQVLSFILVIFCYLDGINPSDWKTSSMTSLTLFGGLDLRLISKRGVMRLSLFFIFARSFIAVLPMSVFLVFFD